MANQTTVADGITDNRISAYYALDRAMIRAHRQDNFEHAESTARILLENADLPLLIRARACIIIGCSEEPDFLDMAEEAVRITQMGLARNTEPNEAMQELLEAAQECYQEAKVAMDRALELEANEAATAAKDPVVEAHAVAQPTTEGADANRVSLPNPEQLIYNRDFDFEFARGGDGDQAKDGGNEGEDDEGDDGLKVAGSSTTALAKKSRAKKKKADTEQGPLRRSERNKSKE